MGLLDEVGKKRKVVESENEENKQESDVAVEEIKDNNTTAQEQDEPVEQSTPIEDSETDESVDNNNGPKHSFLTTDKETTAKGRTGRYSSGDGGLEAGIPLWYSILIGVVSIIIAIDDEWIWIPGTIYGIMFWAYKRVKAAAYELVSIQPSILLSGASAAGVATVASPSIAVTMKPFLGAYGKGFRTLAFNMFLTPSGIVSPLTWALRFGWFTKLVNGKIDDTTASENTFKNRFICMATIGAFSETFARTTTAPFAKFIDLQRKSPGMSPSKVFRLMLKKDGLFGPWLGMAPLRVEVPHMAILLSTWGMSREAVSPYLPVVKEDDVSKRILTRLPADLATGAFAATVAYSITHSFRMSAEQNRKLTYEHFLKHNKESVCPFVFRHGSVSLQQCLALRVPHTALLFGLYGGFLSFFAPQYKESGVAGWGEREVSRFTQYGGQLEDTTMKELSFWQFFGGRMSSSRRYGE